MNFDLNEITKPLLNWYAVSHRKLPWRDHINPYSVWVSEIMLQQTRVEAVKEYYLRFLKDLPDIFALANVREEQLLKLWEGLGYYNRARNMKKAALMIVEEYEGIFPSDYQEILKLPGIGEYTAGAIGSICFGLPTPAVDGNVLRVMARLKETYDCIDDQKTKKRVRDELSVLYEAGHCSELTQALMELGATVCIPKGEPKCDSCPLKKFCRSFEKKTFSQLPVRKEKKNRKIEEKTVFILHTDQQYAVRKRNARGLLANLWEFYHVDKKLEPQEAVRYLSEEGFEPLDIFLL